MHRYAPPPSEVGKTYFDDIGEYTVIEVTRKGLRIQRPNASSELAGDIELKARIHKRIVSEGGIEASKRRQSFRPRKSQAGTREWFYEVIAEIVGEYSNHSDDYMSHEDILDALLAHPEAALLLEQISKEDPEQKPPFWWAGNRIAWFSQQWTVRGTEFPYNGNFQRQRVGDDYDYRKAKGIK